MVQDEQEKWDIVIKPRSGLFRLDLEEVWLYRDLLVMYIRRDIVTFYKQTVLGPLWFVIQPLLTTVMFMFVFGGIAGIPTDGLPQPLFYMAGLLCWNYFSECLSRCSDTFNANQNVFGKVYFPRLVVPLSIVISCMIKMGIQFGLFVLIYIYYLTGPLLSIRMAMAISRKTGDRKTNAAPEKRISKQRFHWGRIKCLTSFFFRLCAYSSSCRLLMMSIFCLNRAVVMFKLTVSFIPLFR